MLLPRGRIAHSRFKIPFDITETAVCAVKRGTMLAELIQVVSLVIWDEAPMTNWCCFEALDRTMKDILSEHKPGNAMLPFGGKPVVLGGDFRQILPVVRVQLWLAHQLQTLGYGGMWFSLNCIPTCACGTLHCKGPSAMSYSTLVNGS